MQVPILIYLFAFACVYALNCDIVVVGGTLASLGAVIHSLDQYSVCLVEPTERVGGQLGEEGVWHIDFNWLYQPNYPDTKIAYNEANIHPLINEIKNKCNTGDCWVSKNCFLYDCIEPIFEKYLRDKTNLQIFYNSVVKSVQKLASRITSIEIITRKPIPTSIDCRTIDQTIRDWYSPKNSTYFEKTVSTIKVNNFIIEGSQYGDVLALSKASFMQGTKYSDTCGQSIVFGILEEYSTKQGQKQKISLEDQDFSLDSFTVQEVWRYRRLKGAGKGIHEGQITLQNWNGPGNDYNGGYLFVSKSDFNLNDWDGGLNYSTLKNAEQRSVEYHEWYKNISRLPLSINKDYFKTCSGVSQLPYIRDGRRSVGYKGFFLQPEDVTGVYVPGGNLTATPFTDRMSIGMYNMDLHAIKNCQYDQFPSKIPLPFFIPLRAYSNQDISNILVVGRAIAQDFFVSSATRTPTTEIGTGAASMWIAMHMIRKKIGSVWNLIQCGDCVQELQSELRMVLPLEWKINGKKYPEEGSQSEEWLE